MSDKKYPVFVNQGDGQKIQVGVAGEVVEGGGRPIEIWDEFKNTPITNVEVGDSPADESAKAPGVVNPDIPSGLPAEPAEGALAEPKAPTPGSNFRRDQTNK